MLKRYDPLSLAQALIQIPSITPQDGGCQQLLSSLFAQAGFSVQEYDYGHTTNRWISHHTPCQEAASGSRSSLVKTLCCVGHTDVVPPGEAQAWTHPPFSGHIDKGLLWGRGAQDMKGALAAMVMAAIDFVQECPHHAHRLCFLITSDEEGSGQDGTQKALESLVAQGESIDWCMVGEPSSTHTAGDTLRIGRRGSLHAYVDIVGQGGHVAYPGKALSPIRLATPLLQALWAHDWDTGQRHPHFPPTHMEISFLNSGAAQVPNVIPHTLRMHLNWRYNPLHSALSLQSQMHQILEQHVEEYTVHWRVSAQPFLSPFGPLLAATQRAVLAVQGIEPTLNTQGGTSDGRFFAALGAEVIECGTSNSLIHQCNESVAVHEIGALYDIYRRIFAELLSA